MPKKKKFYMPEDDMQDEMMEMKEAEMEDMEDMEDMEMHHHMKPMHHHHMKPMHYVLAHAYVPWQKYEKAFSPEEALAKGTLFPELWGVYPIPK